MNIGKNLTIPMVTSNNPRSPFNTVYHKYDSSNNFITSNHCKKITTNSSQKTPYPQIQNHPIDSQSLIQQTSSMLYNIHNKIQSLPPNAVAMKHKSYERRWWTKNEDEQLRQLVENHGAKNWKKIASYLNGRTDVQCLHRWQKVLNPTLVKGPWTKEEDDMIVKMVSLYGPKNWSL